MDALLLKLQKDREPGNECRSYSDDEAFAILERYLRSSMSVLEAAQAMTAMLPSDDRPKEKEGAVALLGSFFCQMAEGIPYHDAAQTKLVRLVLAVSRSYKLLHVPTSDEAAATGGQTYLECLVMSDFKVQIREAVTPYFEDDPKDPDQFSRALNFSTFTARLTQCGFIGIAKFGIWAIRDGLEMTQPTDDQEVLDYNISSAALWIVLAGQWLFDEVVVAPTPEKEGGSNHTGSLYSGPEKGLERWLFWKQRLSSVAATDGSISAKCQRLAKSAVDIMNGLETALSWSPE